MNMINSRTAVESQSNRSWNHRITRHTAGSAVESRK